MRWSRSLLLLPSPSPRPARRRPWCRMRRVGVVVRGPLLDCRTVADTLTIDDQSGTHERRVARDGSFLLLTQTEADEATTSPVLLLLLLLPPNLLLSGTESANDRRSNARANDTSRTRTTRTYSCSRTTRRALRLACPRPRGSVIGPGRMRRPSSRMAMCPRRRASLGRSWADMALGRRVKVVGGSMTLLLMMLMRWWVKGVVRGRVVRTRRRWYRIDGRSALLLRLNPVLVRWMPAKVRLQHRSQVVLHLRLRLRRHRHPQLFRLQTAPSTAPARKRFHLPTRQPPSTLPRSAPRPT